MSPTLTRVPGLPGLPLPGRPAAPRPHALLTPGVLLLADAEPGRTVPIGTHGRRWGPLPPLGVDGLVEAAAEAGVVGAGGAEFPTDRKVASLAGARVSHVIVNASEGEATSGKDAALLAHVPHLVIDGAVAAARALRAPRVVVRVGADRPDLVGALPAAIAERRDAVAVELSVGPAGFVAGEATAVIRAIAGGPALPADLGRPPVLPGRRLGRQRRVLLSNVETFARLAVAVRGCRETSALATASGAVGRPGVAELAAGATVADLLEAAGGQVGAPSILITGGWHGRWVRWDPRSAAAPLTRAGIGAVGGRWGAGAFVWVPEDVAPGAVAAAVAGALAAGTAGQCGPCWRGLPEVAAALTRMAAAGTADATSPEAAGTADATSREAAGTADANRPAPTGREHVEQLLAEVDGRGLCAHPSASVAALRSALDLIGGLR